MIAVVCDGSTDREFGSMMEAVRWLTDNYTFDDVVTRWTVVDGPVVWSPRMVVDGLGRRLEWTRR